MSQENKSVVSQIGGALMAGGASIAILLGLFNQICALTIAGSGLASSPLDAYYLPSYYFTIGGLALFLIGVFIGLCKMSAPNRKSAVMALIASVLFIGAMCIMLCDVSMNDGLKEAAKSAYTIIAIKAGLVFIGLIFLYLAVKKSDITVSKVWKVIVKIAIILLILSSLLMLIPVAGDIIFAFVYLVAGVALSVSLFAVVTNN